MENKNKLTEELKVLENEIHQMKIELKAINSKLEIAYNYENELSERMNFARKQTEEMRHLFFKKSGEISNKYHQMKSIFDVFTGNFYKEVLP